MTPAEHGHLARNRQPVCLFARRGREGAAEDVEKGQAKRWQESILRFPPKQLESIYFLEPGRGREENAQKSVQKQGKMKQTEMSLGEVCPVDRKCFFGIVLKVSFSASAPEARDKKPNYF